MGKFTKGSERKGSVFSYLVMFDCFVAIMALFQDIHTANITLQRPSYDVMFKLG